MSITFDDNTQTKFCSRYATSMGHPEWESILKNLCSNGRAIRYAGCSTPWPTWLPANRRRDDLTQSKHAWDYFDHLDQEDRSGTDKWNDSERPPLSLCLGLGIDAGELRATMQHSKLLSPPPPFDLVAASPVASMI